MATTLRTIGYEGASLEGFLSALRRARVSLLVDVRAVAVSRRKGFSKTALAAALSEAGIGYLHLRDLGDPKPGREAARAGRMAEFRTIYTAHLRGAVAQAALAEAARVAEQRSVCLLCYEADPSGCHRAIVAASIARKTGLAVQHLRPDTPRAAGSATAAA
ncbi:DUF488 domain-containing protein [Siccirubricoccus phaeus]|uniref:DUF488 domain-containing protein n=1 Tax=Siccirubricoccus phaeus TaxID=2595053 RepID=UPI0011F22DC9|nr:DUF488 domain-containing protein [Siccirubricoccus phaeus]